MGQRADELDRKDDLRGFREEFLIADPKLIYLDGNSLGRLPVRTIEVVNHLMRHDWGANLVSSWNGWFELPRRIGGKIARLIGAQPDEVLVSDSTSINLFKLTVAALRSQTPRTGILTDDANFPSDVYVSGGLGADVRLAAVHDDLGRASDRIEEALDANTALLSLSHTLFKSGYVHDMPRLTESAHRAGALALWDLSHSVGVLPIDLNASGVDLAVGCSYKYVTGGPGAPAFLFVRRELQDKLNSPICGWFGHRNAFDFSLEYEPAEGLGRFLVGTPPVLSMAAIEPALDLILEAGIERVRAKSLRQTEFLIELIDDRLIPLGFSLVTPRERGRRGSHVSLAHPEAWRICQALIGEFQVVPDFRAPDVLRLGVTPLSTTFAELETAVERIVGVVEGRRYERYPEVRGRVT